MILAAINRQDRIRVIRIRIHMHRQMAKHNLVTKGSHHFDTIHEIGIIEELSATLHDELNKLRDDMEVEREAQWKHLDEWDTTTMWKTFDL